MKKKIVSVLIATMMMSSMTGCGGNSLTLTNDSFDLELGDSPETHTASYVDVKDEKELKKIDFDFSKVDEMTVGDYSATATLGKDTKNFHITVKDNRNQCPGLCRGHAGFRNRAEWQCES